MEKILERQGKVMEFCQSGKVGTMLVQAGVKGFCKVSVLVSVSVSVLVTAGVITS